MSDDGIYDDAGEPKAFEEFDPRADSTKSGGSTAILLYNDFAKIQKYPQYSELDEKFVCDKVLENGSLANPNDPPIRKVMAEMASYIVTKKYIKDGKETYFKPDTALQYFSTFKALLFTRFRPLGYFTTNPDWYDQLYQGMKVRMATACILRGEKISEKAIGVSRETLLKMCLFLLKQEDQVLGCEERCVLVILFHAVGRGGEISASTWDSTSWDEDRQMLVLDWGEFKKGVQYIMTFHPDAVGWILDAYHALACYLLAGHGRYAATVDPALSGVNWMFPTYVDMRDGGAAAKASRIITKCYNEGVEGVPKALRSHGLRVSSTDDMIFNITLSLFDAIARGGWDCKGDSTFFHYLTQKLHIARAGRALAGWRDARLHVCAPSLEAVITAENHGLVEEFCTELFAGVGVPQLQEDLKQFRNVMVASLLMYHENVQEELGIDALVVRKVHAAAQRRGITASTIRAWGSMIKDQFVVQNARNLGDSNMSDKEQTDHALAILIETSQKQSNEIKELRAGQSRQDKKLDHILDLLVSMQEVSTGSPRRHKKQRPLDPAATTAVTPATGGTTPSSAFGTLMTAGKRYVAPQFDQFLKWDVAKFIVEVVKQGQDPGTSLCFGPSVIKSDRNRGKLVYSEIVKVAPDDKKQYLKASNCPKSGEERNKWLAEIEAFMPRVKVSLVKKLLIEQQELRGAAQDETTIAGLLKKQNVNVSAIAGLIERNNAARRKKEAAS
jgi:hypothetical protein